MADRRSGWGKQRYGRARGVSDASAKDYDVVRVRILTSLSLALAIVGIVLV